MEQRGNKFRVKWWEGEYYPSGAKKFAWESGFSSHEEAENYGLDRESDIRNDRHIRKSDGSLLMKDYLKSWPDTLDVGHLRERNVRSYIRLYIEPRWGDSAVGDIKPSMYRAWEKWIKAQPNIGHSYAGEILRVFAMLMDDAVDDGLRTASPVKRKTRRGRYKKKPREKKRPMDMADVFQLALNGLTYWGLPGFAFNLTKPFTGMRPAELYALRREYCYPSWPASDPDDDQRREATERYNGVNPMPALRVQYQHQRKDGALELFPPKYESYRTLVIPRFLAELTELLLSSHDSEWAFVSISGGQLANANYAYHYWRPTADGRPATSTFERTRLGQHQVVDSRRPLPEIPATAYAGKRLYLLRHGHKEWLDEDGHPRVAVEHRMGHELPGVEGTYSNVTPAMERAIMESLQERWLRFVRTLGSDWRSRFPSSCPVDLLDWMESQVRVAAATDPATGS
ncbi:integrase [Streptomyces sp. NPDC056670]|uniref:integrase n=1 Tax=Streptomyces sp. NPDC056670 TaxID=3345904 RepID=UPI003674D652